MASSPRKPIEPHRRRRRNDWLIVVGVLAVLAGALAYAARDAFQTPLEKPAVQAKPQAKREPPRVKVNEFDPALVDDDGQMLWVSPTNGPPLDLANLPPGVEFILALRPRALLAHPEADKLLAALGPWGQAAVRAAEPKVGRPLADIDRLLVGWEVDRAGQWHATLIDSQTAGPVPPLARDVERLLAHTDSTRHVTIIFLPRVLLGDSRSALQSAASQLRGPLEWFLGNDIGAAALSMHWDENFFIELVAVPTLDSSPERMSDELAARVSELPHLVEEFVLGLDASPHGRRIVARFPEMVRKLAAYTRHGFDRDAAVLRCYLPAVAGHNLLMGAELTLAEGWRSAARGGASPLAAATSPATISERLKRKTSLRFAREELEAALDMLAADVGVEIVIRGEDLQLEGITRNQLFAIDLADRPAEEILVEILRRANPDKSASGPGDPRQKLVYVLGPDAVIITTRAGAERRGEPLSDAFMPN